MDVFESAEIGEGKPGAVLSRSEPTTDGIPGNFAGVAGWWNSDGRGAS